MPIQINEIIVSVSVQPTNTGSGGNAPSNDELNALIKKALEDLNEVIQSKNER